MIEVIKTELEGVLLIKIDVFKDHRGEYIEIYNKKFYDKRIKNINFVQDNISVSKKNVLRGIHGDKETWKLVTCLLGRLYLVIVNCDETSKKFGEWQSFILTDKNRYQILVPPKYGVAHLALTDKIIFHYKQSTYYNPSRQFTYKWNDSRFDIKWPIKKPILSKRDELGYVILKHSFQVKK